MKGKLITINDGEMVAEDLTTVPGVEKLQEVVGGYIESVPYLDKITWEGKNTPCVAFCNEEGKLEGLPVNILATKLWYENFGHPVDDVLCGPVCVIIGDQELLDEL